MSKITKTHAKKPPTYAFKFFDRGKFGCWEYPYACRLVSPKIMNGQWAPRITGPLQICVRGYHACATLSQLREWGSGFYILALVELSGVVPASTHPNETDKRLSRSFRVIGTLTNNNRYLPYTKVGLRRSVRSVLSKRKISAREQQRILTALELV